MYSCQELGYFVVVLFVFQKIEPSAEFSNMYLDGPAHHFSFISGKLFKIKAGRGSCCPGLSHPALTVLRLLAAELIFRGSG